MTDVSNENPRELPYDIAHAAATSSPIPESGEFVAFDWAVTDSGERTDIILNVSQDEFTAIATALDVGRDIAYNKDSDLLWWIWSRAFRGNAQDIVDYCVDFLPSSSIFTYLPQNPFTDPDVTPTGYLLPPFWIVGDFLPEFIPDWFADLILDAVTEFTNYEPTDVLTTIGNFPLYGNWQTLLEGDYPRIEIAFNGIGTMELHLLSVPFGGTCLITLDDPASVDDLITGLWNDSDYLIELERDLSQIPPEIYPIQIIEYPVTTAGDHIIYITFIPSVDATLVPLRFGGGLRKAVWCSDNNPPPSPEDCDIPTMLQDETFFETEYLPVVFGEFFTETVAREATNEALYDTTPQSIGASIPTGAPDALERNALCAAINRYVALYCSTKLCLIQSKNFLEVFWTKMAAAANEFYEVASNLMSPIYSPNISSCFVTDADAITALQDTAAMEEIACFIYDELKTVVIDEADFNTAVLDASTTLTGTAQDVACLMLLDNNVSIYISFLEAYNIALTQQSTGSADVDCPCETDTYWILVQDFEQGQHGWFPEGGNAIYSGGKWGSKASPSGASVRIIKNLDLPYVLKAAAMQSYNDGFTSQGGDAARFSGRVEQYAAGNETLLGNSGFRNTNLSLLYNEGISLANLITSQSLVVRNDNIGTTSGTNYGEIRKVVYYGLPNGSNKPPGSVWTDVIPSSGNLFP